MFCTVQLARQSRRPVLLLAAALSALPQSSASNGEGSFAPRKGGIAKGSSSTFSVLIAAEEGEWRLFPAGPTVPSPPLPPTIGGLFFPAPNGGIGGRSNTGFPTKVDFRGTPPSSS